MKLYDFTAAPSPRRTRVLLAEKGIEVETIQVDLMKAEQLKPEFTALNPFCTVPVLVTDDGTVLTENTAIASYLEQTVPDPPLLGTSPSETALIWQWNARCEQNGFIGVAEAFRNQARGFETRALTGPLDFKQIPELVERGKARFFGFLGNLNEHLAGREYLVGDAYSFADITTMVCIDFAGFVKLEIEEGQTNLKNWHARVSARPSAKA